MAIQPKVLLLDEPFGALDAKVRQGLRRWLRRLHDEIHVTSVFVTHDQEEALEVADRVVVMNEGRIEQVGTPDDVFHRPASAFVMDFLGNVNLFHGRVEAGKAVFGSLVIAPPGGLQLDGETARLLIRPHDLEIRSDDQSGPAIRAGDARAIGRSGGEDRAAERYGPAGVRGDFARAFPAGAARGGRRGVRHAAGLADVRRRLLDLSRWDGGTWQRCFFTAKA